MSPPQPQEGSSDLAIMAGTCPPHTDLLNMLASCVPGRVAPGFSRGGPPTAGFPTRAAAAARSAGSFCVRALGQGCA